MIYYVLFVCTDAFCGTVICFILCMFILLFCAQYIISILFLNKSKYSIWIVAFI